MRTGRVLLVSSGAFLLYGAWALWANWGHGQIVGLRSAATQGSFSFLATALMASAMELVFAGRKAGGAGRFWLTALGPYSLGLLVLTTAHALMGTPELVLTVLPSASIGLAFAMLYTRRLSAGPAALGEQRRPASPTSTSS